jgi:ATP-dependent DNA ligase
VKERSPVLEASLPDLVHLIRAQGLEGLVAKRRDSRYEAGQRSRGWRKMRINRGQEFVIGGYTPTRKTSTRSSADFRRQKTRRASFRDGQQFAPRVARPFHPTLQAAV